MNNLDAVWASLSSADRIVLLGHDRDLLTDGEKARLAAVAADKADRRAAVRPSPRSNSRGKGSQVRGQNRGQQRGQGRGRGQRARRAA